MAGKEELKKMVDAINKENTYRVLTKEEYEDLVARASMVPATSTPNPDKSGATKPKTPKLKPNIIGQSPIARLSLLGNSQQNTSSLPHGPYIPKLPIFSGSEEPAKGEASYELWSFEVKCLKQNEFLSELLLLQAIRNSLRGTAREMLIPLGEDASVDDILEKLDGFYGDVDTTQTLMQSFYSDCQKESESIVAFGSRLEHTLTRAIASGHIDDVAKDAMLCSKFWTGLRNQTLKNSTRYLYSSINDFQTLLKEIRKVDIEICSSKTTKKQAAQQLSGQVENEDTSAKLLKQMSELMGCMKKMTDNFEKQSKVVAESKTDFSNQEQSTYSSRGHNYRGYGRGYNRDSYRGGYGRGYQNDYSHESNQRGNFKRGGGRGRFRGTYRGVPTAEVPTQVVLLEVRIL